MAWVWGSVVDCLNHCLCSLWTKETPTWWSYMWLRVMELVAQVRLPSIHPGCQIHLIKLCLYCGSQSENCYCYWLGPWDLCGLEKPICVLWCVKDLTWSKYHGPPILAIAWFGARRFKLLRHQRRNDMLKFGTTFLNVLMHPLGFKFQLFSENYRNYSIFDFLEFYDTFGSNRANCAIPKCR